MRNILFIICGLSVFVAGFVSVANADMPNINCSHHVSDEIHADQDCSDHQNHDKADKTECQDCCCIHSHAFTTIFTGASFHSAPKHSMAFEPSLSLISKDLSSLHRPPIA